MDNKKCPLRKTTTDYKEETFGDCIKAECEWWTSRTESYYDHEAKTQYIEGCAIRLLINRNVWGESNKLIQGFPE